MCRTASNKALLGLLVMQNRGRCYLPQSLGRSLVALREADEGFREVRWVKDVEVGVQQSDVERKLVWSVRAHLDDAAIGSVRRDRHCQRQQRPCLIGWRVDANSGAIPPGRSASGALHIPGCLIVGKRPWLESGAGRRLGCDSVRSKNAPVIPVNVPSKQIPTAAPRNEALRFAGPHGLVAVVVDVAEAQPLAGSNSASDRAQNLRIHGWSGSRDAHSCGPQRVDPMPQP